MIKRVFTILAVALAGLLIGSPAFADPNPDGQGNRDWGKVISNTAQLDTSGITTDDGSDAKGGGMGLHARSTQAANNNGGFTEQDTDGDGDGGNAFGIEFNTDSDGDGDNGRLGVGNATRSAPHNEESPSAGGNGRHATNNVEASATLNPLNGDLTVNAGGTAPDVSDELREGTSKDTSDDSDSSSSDSASSDSASSDSSSSDSDSSSDDS